MPLAMKHERLLDGDGAVTAKVENVTIRFCKKTKKRHGNDCLSPITMDYLIFYCNGRRTLPRHHESMIVTGKWQQSSRNYRWHYVQLSLLASGNRAAVITVGIMFNCSSTVNPFFNRFWTLNLMTPCHCRMG
jgi:hypothetical protein